MKSIASIDQSGTLEKKIVSIFFEPRFWLLVILTALVAAAVRLPGLSTDFWLDEIWSYDIARSLHHFRDIIFNDAGRIDNNHPLNTLWIFWIGPGRPIWMYRLVPLLCGIATPPVAIAAFWRESKSTAIVAAILLTFSFPFVFYSSEARGYSMAAFFAVLAMACMFRDLRSPSRLAVIGFNISCILGFLSHLTFIHFYLAGMFWLVLKVRQRSPGIGWQLLDWSRLNALPLLFCAALYSTFIKHLIIGGASPTDPLQTIIQLFSISVNGPLNSGATSIALFSSILFFASLIILARRGDDRWLFYALAVVVAPAFLCVYDLVLSARPQPLMPRYFLVAAAMMLIAIAQGISQIGKSPSARPVIALFVAAFICGSAVWQFQIVKAGRGGYSKVVERMLRASPNQEVTFTSDVKTRTKRVIDFYESRVVFPGKTIKLYEDDRDEKSHPVQWRIVSAAAATVTPATQIVDSSGVAYRLDSVYPAIVLSGSTLCLYRIEVDTN